MNFQFLFLHGTAVKFNGSVMSGNREFKEFREFREIAPDCTAIRCMSPLSRNFDHILYQQDSRVSVRLSLTSSAVICFILKLLILLKFLIVCHAQPYAFRLCRNMIPVPYSERAYVLYSKNTLFFFEKVEGLREAEKSFFLLIKKKVFPPS